MYSFAIEARKMLACALIFALATAFAKDAMPAAGAGSDPVGIARLREQAAHLRPGVPIEVRLQNREKIRGRLGAVEPDGFALLPQGASTPERRVAFAEVRSIKEVQGKHGVAIKVAVIVVVAVGVAAVVIYLAAQNAMKGLRF